MENYKIQSKIGSGNFAKVYLATHLETQQEVALKMINKKELTNSKNVERLRREIKNMQTLGDHKNIISIIETFQTSEHYVIAMEYLPGGELFDYVLERDGLSEAAAKGIFRELAEAVQHCHTNGVTHRDLKLENILLDSKNCPKIADFGLSKEAHKCPIFATYCGSPLYTAPEILHGRKYMGPECDVWSMGVILYTMLTATMPFDDTNFPKFMKKIDRGEYSQPSGVSDEAKDLLSKMLDPRSFSRYTIDQVLGHPWLVGKTERKRKTAILTPPELKIDSVSDCNCSCHNAELLEHRDSVITKHCSDCELIVANDNKQSQEFSRCSSTTSSGYGSEFGSQYLPVESPVCARPQFSKLLNVEERRYSLPRKNKLSIPHGRNSVPMEPPQLPKAVYASECCSDDNDGTVLI